jgi:hypothetical protein
MVDGAEACGDPLVASADGSIPGLVHQTFILVLISRK